MLTTLLLSFGVPLLLGGDELGRTQRGNNNAYCQDNDITWFDWAAVDDELLAFTRRVVALRRGHPVFRRKRFLSGIDTAELSWFAPTGRPMAPDDWNDPRAHSVAIVLDGNDAPDRSADGAVLVDDDFLVLVNGWREGVTFTVPPGEQHWTVELRTEDPDAASGPTRRSGDTVTLGPESIVVLRSSLRVEG
jgi:glycogen operon protein